jgi:putative MATE family efflux protein
MNQSVQNNLGTGSVGRLLIRLALPAVISQLVNMLYNIVDRIYIGHIPENGVVALTGLGLCFPVIMVISAFASLFGIGGATLSTIEMGRDHSRKAEQILGNCVTALLFVSVLLTAFCLIFGRPLLMLFGASSGTIEYAWGYLKIYVCGTVFVQLSLGLNTFISCQGFSTKAMVTVLIGAVLNTILDPVFIFVFGMGVWGAALATILSQGVSAVWVFHFLKGKQTGLKIRLQNMRPDRKTILSVMALGVSPFIMQATESLLNICFNSSLQRYGGDIAVGTMTILSSVGQMFMLPMHGIMQGAQPIISFNYGAGNSDRVRKAVRLSIAVCIVYSTSMCALVELFPAAFIGIFNRKKELMDMAVWALRLYCSGMFMLGAQTACQQSFVALGQSRISMILACLRKLILMIPLIYILPKFFDDKVFAVFLAEPIADIGAAAVTAVTFAVVVKRILRPAAAH